MPLVVVVVVASGVVCRPAGIVTTLVVVGVGNDILLSSPSSCDYFRNEPKKIIQAISFSDKKRMESQFTIVVEWI